MQALVRAHRAHQCQMLEKSSGQEKKDEEFWIDSVILSSVVTSTKTFSYLVDFFFKHLFDFAHCLFVWVLDIFLVIQIFK